MDKLSKISTNGIYFLLLLTPLFWGGAFSTTKHVVSELAPLTAATIRFGLAGALMALWLTIQGGWNWPLIRRSWSGLFLFAVTGIFLYNALFFISLQYTTAINAALVIVVNPVLTALVAVAFLGETWSWQLGLGVLLSFVGVLITITKGSLLLLSTLSFNRGDILLFGAVLAWTSYTCIGKVVMREVPPLLATTVSTLIGAIMLGLASLYEKSWYKVASLSSQTTGELFFLAVFATVIAFVLYNMGIKQIGASKASAYINLMPVNAMWIAAVFYGEVITPAHLLGVVLIVNGVVLTTFFHQVSLEESSHASPMKL